MVLNQWWTSENGKTGKNGVFKTRGFLGEYEVTVEHGGDKKTVDTALVRRRSIVSVEL